MLASASPRRKILLEQIGVVPDALRPAGIDESPKPGETPRNYCRRMAREKALAVPAGDDELILAADTIVAAGRRILGKPENEAQASRFLQLLSGRRHVVMTSVALRRQDRVRDRIVKSTVKMKRLSSEEIANYLASGEWRGKAGAYAIQGKAGAFIPWISGSITAIIGLPLTETAALLSAHGYLPGSEA